MNCEENYIHPAAGEASEMWKVFDDHVRPYTDGGFGLDIGCGGWKVPGSIGIDYRAGVADIVGDVRQGLDALLVISPKASPPFDYIVSSHLIEDFNEKQQIALCADWIRYLKLGGLLILYVPEKGKFTGTNCCHVREFVPGDMEKLLKDLKLEQVAVRYEDLPGYGILGIGRKIVE